jgi:hypothetical protein
MTAVSLLSRRRDRRPGRLALLVIMTGLLAGCGGSSADRASTAPSPRGSTERPTIRPSGSLPPEAVAKPGGKYYAVFLAVAADAKDPALVDAQEQAKALGYQGGVGDVNCTPGARTALNLNDTAAYTAYSIFFETNEQAQTFLNSFSGKVVGTAFVTAGCLD